MTGAGEAAAVPDVRVVSGDPTPEELAAVVAVLLASAGRRPAAAPPAHWLRAARQEGLGGPPVSGRADLA